MANRYWVGGTGSWDATTTHWSASSGGASGASVPTLADDVFFDTLSNATGYTVTLTANPAQCRSVTIGAPLTGNITIAGSTPWSIYGSFIIAATGVTRTFTSDLNFRATTTGLTITTNGVALASAITLIGAGGGWTLGSALTTTGSLTLTQGAFDTANFNLTTSGNFVSTGALTRSLTLGSSSINCTTWSALAQTNLTINAGTSTIQVNGGAGTFNGGGLTYYNVTKFTTGSNAFVIGDANNTFNAVSVTNSSGLGYLSITGNQTIGTLTANGNTYNARMFIVAATIGTQIILTVTSFVTNGYIDFRDINIAGAASPLTVSTGGDCGNNTNITLATPKNVYWNLIAGGNWNTSTAWATTSGGTPAIANYPLAQDTAIIQDTGLNSGATIGWGSGSYQNTGNVDCSTRTLPMTLNGTGVFQTIYGNLTLSSAVTSITGNIGFSGYSKTQTITPAAVSFGANITIGNSTVTVTLLGALTCTTALTLSTGTLNLNNYNLTINNFIGSNSNTRAIAFGTGAIYLTGSNGTIWTTDTGTNLSYTGSPNVYCTYSGSTGTRTIQGSAVASATETNVFNFFVNAGSDIVTVLGARDYRTLDFTGFSGTLSAWATSLSIFGDFVASSTMTITPNTVPLQFLASLITQKITTNTKTLLFPVSAYNSLQLQDDLTIGSAYTFLHSTKTLDLNNKNLTCGFFNTSNSNIRTIAFGTGQIYLTGNNAVIWTFNPATNLTITGSAIVNATYLGSTGTRSFAGYASGSALINVNVTAGTDIISLTNQGYNNVNLTGFAGSTLTLAGMQGDLTLGSGMTLSSVTACVLRGSGTVTSNNVLFDAPMTVTASGTYTLADNLTIGSTRTFTLTQGTFNLNAKTASMGLFSSTGSIVRSIAFNGGTIVTSGATFTASGTNLTTSGTGVISMTSASSKTFAGGGFSYPTLNQGGAGALVITGANTFQNITNTVQPATITLPSSTTTTVSNFNLNGTAGNLITLNSSTSGTQATLARIGGGTVSVNYLSIKDSSATPSLTWYAGTTSTNVSNNTGWIFTAAPTTAVNGLFFGVPF